MKDKLLFNRDALLSVRQHMDAAVNALNYLHDECTDESDSRIFDTLVTLQDAQVIFEELLRDLDLFYGKKRKPSNA
jgi:hypothetical protein